MPANGDARPTAPPTGITSGELRRRRARPMARSRRAPALPLPAAQWAAFLRKGSLDAGDLDLKAVLTEIGNFLLPPLNALRDAGRFSGSWNPGGPAWLAAH